jgi:hypothetical protein
MTKEEQAFKLFDAYNQQDPEIVIFENNQFPAAYFHSLQLHQWVKKLAPTASESLSLASRCQHIGRWESPRTNYPAGKAGYLTWRTDLKHFHAQKAGKILHEVGYDEETIADVQTIIKKQNIKANKDVQIMEDALCLVFLQFQYDDFITKHDDEKVIRIVQKSWNKMSGQGRNLALTLSFHGRGKSLLERALN